jgi:MFS family permease
MLGLLTAAYALNLLDRVVINVLAEAIKHDLNLADWQVGALSGLAFAFLYTTVAIPLARMADRKNRVRIIGWAVLCWSAFTALCGTAGGFIQFLLMRIGVGLGEAGGQPPSQSLIAESFPVSWRSRALAIFGLGSPLGASIGIALGGILFEAVGWRWTMVAAGAPGLIIGLLVLFTLKDQRPEIPRSEARPFFADMGKLLQKRAFIYMSLGVALLAFVNNASTAWSVPFFLRNYSADLAAIGAPYGRGATSVISLVLGLSGLTAGLGGAFVGGWLGDRWGVKNVRAYALIPAVASACAVVGHLLVYLAPNGGWALAMVVFSTMFSNVWQGPAAHALQCLAGVQSRATVMALVLFVSAIIGTGLGPLLVGAMSDTFGMYYGSAEGLRYALITGMIAGVLSAFFYWLASFRLKQEFETS